MLWRRCDVSKWYWDLVFVSRPHMAYSGYIDCHYISHTPWIWTLKRKRAQRVHAIFAINIFTNWDRSAKTRYTVYCQMYVMFWYSCLTCIVRCMSCFGIRVSLVSSDVCHVLVFVSHLYSCLTCIVRRMLCFGICVSHVLSDVCHVLVFVSHLYCQMYVVFWYSCLTCMKIPPFDSLVWGSLRLSPISYIESSLSWAMKGKVWMNEWELYVWQSCVETECYFVTSSSARSKYYIVELLLFVSLSSGSQLCVHGYFCTVK